MKFCRALLPFLIGLGESVSSVLSSSSSRDSNGDSNDSVASSFSSSLRHRRTTKNGAVEHARITNEIAGVGLNGDEDSSSRGVFRHLQGSFEFDVILGSAANNLDGIQFQVEVNRNVATSLRNSGNTGCSTSFQTQGYLATDDSCTSTFTPEELDPYDGCWDFELTVTDPGVVNCDLTTAVPSIISGLSNRTIFGIVTDLRVAPREPTGAPSSNLSLSPTKEPTLVPTKEPTEAPVPAPTEAPVADPTEAPVVDPSPAPTCAPCEDDPEFVFTFYNKKGIPKNKGGCDHVAKKPKKRCKKFMGEPEVKIKFSCPVTCNACPDCP